MGKGGGLEGGAPAHVGVGARLQRKLGGRVRCFLGSISMGHYLDSYWYAYMREVLLLLRWRSILCSVSICATLKLEVIGLFVWLCYRCPYEFLGPAGTASLWLVSASIYVVLSLFSGLGLAVGPSVDSLIYGALLFFQ